jgi:hypothetical protein
MYIHPARHHHFSMAEVAGGVGNGACSYLPQNDPKRVLPSESRFSGLYGPSPSSFLVLNSLIAHIYYLTARAALSTAITRRSQRRDEQHQEVQVTNVLQGARCRYQA